MLCFYSTNGLHKTKGISTFGFRIPTISSLRGKCGENPKIKNRLTYHNQQIKRFFLYPEPVLKSQKLRKYYKSEINHNSLYINK